MIRTLRIGLVVASCVVGGALLILVVLKCAWYFGPSWGGVSGDRIRWWFTDYADVLVEEGSSFGQRRLTWTPYALAQPVNNGPPPVQSAMHVALVSRAKSGVAPEEFLDASNVDEWAIFRRVFFLKEVEIAREASAQIGVVPARESSADWVGHEVALGWPWVCVTGGVMRLARDIPPGRTQFMMAEFGAKCLDSMTYGFPTIMPKKIIWSGYLANTAVFASGLGVMSLAGYGVWRVCREVRKRRDAREGLADVPSG